MWILKFIMWECKISTKDYYSLTKSLAKRNVTHSRENEFDNTANIYRKTNISNPWFTCQSEIIINWHVSIMLVTLKVLVFTHRH